MAAISLRISDEELTLFKLYAKINNKSLSDTIRSTMLEHIEDEYDLRIFAEYESAKQKGNIKTYSHDEAWKELGL